MRLGYAYRQAQSVIADSQFPRQTIHGRLRRGGAGDDEEVRFEILASEPYLHLPYARRPLLRLAGIVVHDVAPRERRHGDGTHAARRHKGHGADDSLFLRQYCL